MSVFSLYILVFDMFTVLCLHQLLPMITRNYLKEGYMEKTGPMVSSLKSLERHLHAYIISLLLWFLLTLTSKLVCDYIMCDQYIWMCFCSSFRLWLTCACSSNLFSFLRISLCDRRFWGNEVWWARFSNAHFIFEIKCFLFYFVRSKQSHSKGGGSF